MKTWKNFLGAVLLMMAAVPALVACGDDDDIDLGTPQYEGISGKYTIDTPASPYQSIELGASGDYIVIKKSSSYAAGARSAEAAPQGVFKRAQDASRATDYNGVIYGRYTQQADGRLNLEGFGIVEIVYGTGDEVVGFNLTPASGGMLELDVTKEKVMADDTKTNAICRTWKIESIREVEYEGGRKVYDETFTAGDPSGYGDDYPTEVLISKSGTYLVYYQNGYIGISSWKWKNQDAGTFYYSWDNSWYDDEFATVTFEGKSVTVYERYEYGDGYVEETYSRLVEK